MSVAPGILNLTLSQGATWNVSMTYQTMTRVCKRAQVTMLQMPFLTLQMGRESYLAARQVK